MYFSIIINTHEQSDKIKRCIQSCLNQSFNKKYEILIIDTSKNKIDKNSKLLKSKKIIYQHCKIFSKYPEINQLKKIAIGIKKSRGKWICLLDGDDFFNKNKLNFIHKNHNLNDKLIIQDNYSYFNEDKKRYLYKKSKQYKNNFLFKKLFSIWPIIYGTSSISGNKKLFSSFFKKVSLTKWNFIAIDALIVLYSLNKNLLINSEELLTFKSIGHNNLSLKYTFFSKKYWKRRYQQIKYWEFLTNKKIFNLDKLISHLINSIF